MVIAIIILFLLNILLFCVLVYAVGIFQFQIDKLKKEVDATKRL